MTTIHDLNQKSWYRLVKVIYIGCWISASGFLIIITLVDAIGFPTEGTINDFLLGGLIGGLVVVPLIFLLIAGVFHYVVTGRFILPFYREKKSSSVVTSVSSKKASNDSKSITSPPGSKKVIIDRYKYQIYWLLLAIGVLGMLDILVKSSNETGFIGYAIGYPLMLIGVSDATLYSIVGWIVTFFHFSWVWILLALYIRAKYILGPKS